VKVELETQEGKLEALVLRKEELETSQEINEKEDQKELEQLEIVKVLEAVGLDREDLNYLEDQVVDIDRNDFEEFPVMLHPEEELAGNL